MVLRVMVCYLAWLSGVSGVKNITGGVSRHLRSIGFPEGSGMGIFFALGIPVDIPNKSVIFSLYFEANYALPNSSYYWDEPYLWKRSLNRQLVYRVLVNKLESVGYSGEDCLLKMICEAANEPLSNNGVVGEILQILFTPSSSQDEGLPSEIVEAEHAKDCDNYHKNCPQSPLALISRYHLKEGCDKYLKFGHVFAVSESLLESCKDMKQALFVRDISINRRNGWKAKFVAHNFLISM